MQRANDHKETMCKQNFVSTGMCTLLLVARTIDVDGWWWSMYRSPYVFTYIPRGDVTSVQTPFYHILFPSTAPGI
jgi:hypothetical protein